MGNKGNINGIDCHCLINVSTQVNNYLAMMKPSKLITVTSFFIMVFLMSCTEEQPLQEQEGLDEELKLMLEALGGEEAFLLPRSNDYTNIPQDPNNPLNASKISLGNKLFFETGLAINPMNPESRETYSCATCHVPGAGFQAGVRQGIADGGMGFGYEGDGRFPNPNYEIHEMDIPPIRVPNNMNMAYVENTTWNGKLGAGGSNYGTETFWVDDLFLETNHLGFSGVETQAIAGLEFHRMGIDMELVSFSYYKDLFDMAFPDYSEEERYTFETAGLAIAAYERTMMTNKAPFQEWLKGYGDAMTESQKEGALLFFGKANCVDCHTGPALNKNEFFALGMDDLTGEGVVGEFLDFDLIQKGRGGFTRNPEDDYKFKVPQIYNLKHTNFLGHGANFTSIEDIIKYKNAGVSQNPIVPQSQLADEFVPLGLNGAEINQLVDFVENALYDPNMYRYVPASVASGNCYPNNDYQSQVDMGCE